MSIIRRISLPLSFVTSPSVKKACKVHLTDDAKTLESDVFVLLATYHYHFFHSLTLLLILFLWSLSEEDLYRVTIFQLMFCCSLFLFDFCFQLFFLPWGYQFADFGSASSPGKVSIDWLDTLWEISKTKETKPLATTIRAANKKKDYKLMRVVTPTPEDFTAEASIW